MPDPAYHNKAAKLFARKLWPLGGLVLCFAALAASFFGSRYLPLDLLSHFRLHMVGMVVVWLLAIWWSRRWLIVAAAGAAVLVLLIGVLLPLAVRRDSGPAENGSGRHFTLVSFNTWLRQHEWREIEVYLRRVKPDFVVLVEAGRAIKPLFAALKDIYAWQSECAAWRRCHVAILSRHRWRKSAFERRTDSKPPFVWVKFGRELSNLTLIGTHIDRPTNVAISLRHVSTLAKRVRGLRGPVVVAGDFNATPWSYIYRSFAGQSGLRGFSAIAPTWPAYPVDLPQLPIDHVFASPGVVVRLLDVGPPMGSDHRSIRVNISLPRR